MKSLACIHVRLEGFSAFFKHPLTISGTQISMPTPSYSTILGLISACAGKTITHKDTRIGFEFRCSSSDIELERTDRMLVDNKSQLKPHKEGQGILKRYIYFRPKLDLYLTNLNLKESFENPVSTPSLGRSQDIAWINFVKEIELTPRQSGLLGPTMTPFIQENISGLILRCPEWFDNTMEGRTRLAGPFGRYQAMLPTTNGRFQVSLPELYHPSDAISEDDVIYLHKWLEA